MSIEKVGEANLVGEWSHLSCRVNGSILSYSRHDNMFAQVTGTEATTRAANCVSTDAGLTTL